MQVGIVSTVRAGLERSGRRDALALLGLYFVVGLANAVVWHSIAGQYAADGKLESLLSAAPVVELTQLGTTLGQGTPLALLDLPVDVLLVLLGVVYLAYLAVSVGAIRTLVGSPTGGLSPADFTRRLGWSLVHLVVGVALSLVAIFLGLAFFFVPGVYLLVALAFHQFEVVLNDRHVLSAVAASWALTDGHRLNLFLVFLAASVVMTVLLALGSALAAAGPTVYAISRSLVTSVAIVFGIATAAEAYRELAGKTGTGWSDTESPDYLTA